MILEPVTLVDCVAFCVFLAPQLIEQAGLFSTVIVLLKALPFLILILPIQFVWNRYWRNPSSHKSSYLRGSTIFEDIVIRCVRYAFKHMPPQVGRVFFSKEVALPFVKWRMKRHGLDEFPVHWEEHTAGEGDTKVNGIWIKHQPERDPDIVVYYAHGGGFAMGSCYFYLEFLLAWHNLLLDAGYENPAIFALDYTLVPDKVYPHQVLQTLHGYKHVLDVAKDASRVCISGDSAGGTLMLSLLLELGVQIQHQQPNATKPGIQEDLEGFSPTFAIPRMAALISPWITLQSDFHYPSNIDYLDRRTLWRYGSEYANNSYVNNALASPGNCDDMKLWKAASPERGYFITYGGEEVLAPDVNIFARRLDQAKIEVEARRFDGGVHAWPVASLFLSNTRQKRLYGLRTIVGEIRKRVDKIPSPGIKSKNGYQIRSSR